MTKRLITIFTLLISSTQLSFSQDTLYFDINWDPSSQKNHAFYRPLPLKKLGELVLIKDYYKNGNLQMQGYVLEKDQEAYVGDIYYYYENGFDQSFRQYENKSSINELTYYHNDGSIWQKITYNKEGEKENIKTFINGKQIAEAKIDPLAKLSGVFSYAQPISHYDQNRKQDPEKEFTPPVYIEKYPVIAPPDTGETTPSPIVNKKPPYYITTFWQNGKIASQQKVAYSAYYGTDVVDEKYFDQNGQLLSTVSKDKNVAYKKFDYYTKNYFAQKVKESFSYINNTLNGKSISYDPDGTITNSTTYHDGQISQKEIYKNGRIIKTNLYKNDEPYSGNFEIQFGDDYGIKQIFTLNNGTKTGEETTISLADTSEIAKGTYQNGKPWEGSFLTHEQTDNVQLLSYKNGKLNGVQKNLTSVYTLLTKEEYETVDNIRQGYRKIYDDEKLIAESIYKNDKVFSGSIIDDETIITYVNGKKNHESIGTNKYLKDNKNEIFYDDHENISKVIYSDFTIEENPQEKYEGLYQNGKPYSGYFRIDTLIDNIYLVNYLEKGQLKYKYYFEFLEQLDEYQHYTYNKKTTYRNGKIINGKSFKLIDRNALIESSYNNEKLVRIDLNLFAMHYFGRYSAELKEDKIIISQFNYPKYLEVSKENNTFVASFYEDNKLLKKGSSETLIKEGSPNSITFYYLKDNKINKLSKPIVFGLKDEEDETDRYLNMIFQMFPIESGNSIQTLFAEVAHNLTEKELGDEWFDSFASDTPFKEENYLSIVQYDDKGQISYGIRVTKQSDNKILLEGYSDNVIKKKIVVNSLKELLANDKQILEKLSYHLLNE